MFTVRKTTMSAFWWLLGPVEIPMTSLKHYSWLWNNYARLWIHQITHIHSRANPKTLATTASTHTMDCTYMHKAFMIPEPLQRLKVLRKHARPHSPFPLLAFSAPSAKARASLLRSSWSFMSLSVHPHQPRKRLFLCCFDLWSCLHILLKASCLLHKGLVLLH